MPQIGFKKFFWLKKFKKLYYGYIITDINSEKIVGMFYEKKIAFDKSNWVWLKKFNWKSNWKSGKASIIHLIVQKIDQKDIII